MDTANCLMLLSRVGEIVLKKHPGAAGRVYACKTCNREFPSFQALGGHRASHTKPSLEISTGHHPQGPKASDPPSEPKAHRCSICGLKFPIGQALGGHMRRHRAEILKKLVAPRSFPAMKKSTNKRILCLDLNLSPFENDLRLELGKISSCTVDLAT
ncbi:hypothetical protein CRG98_043187 [Punica granatum]|nr:hypothetical protein CRG98_043187 [Punica granatum]